MFHEPLAGMMKESKIMPGKYGSSSIFRGSTFSLEALLSIYTLALLIWLFKLGNAEMMSLKKETKAFP